MAQEAIPPAPPDPAPNLLAISPDPRPLRSVPQLINLCIGFMAVQFAWCAMMVRFSPMLESMGADRGLIGLIWCAGPVAGLLFQPLSGMLSDCCRSRMGRRRPFLLVGTAVMLTCLLLLPDVPTLGMAALLWFGLEAGSNTINGAYRPLIPDTVHRSQHQAAYSFLCMGISLGALAAFLTGSRITDPDVLFRLCGVVLLTGMLWTILTCDEPPAEKLPVREAGKFTVKKLVSPWLAARNLTREGFKLCLANGFAWYGIFCMFIFFSLFVTHRVFHAEAPGGPIYQQGVQWAYLCYALQNVVCLGVSPWISSLCRSYGERAVHGTGLLSFATGFLIILLIREPWAVMAAMGLTGLGVATTLTIPLTVFTSRLPAGKEGIMLAAYNQFIAMAALLCSLVTGQLVSLLNNDSSVAMGIGALSMVVSWLIFRKVQDVPDNKVIPLPPLRPETEETRAS